MYKNIEKQTKLRLKDQIEYQPHQVVSKTLVQNDKMGVTLFSFDKDEEISTHAAGGDAMVTVLEGTGRFTVDGEVFILTEGETLIMPKDIPHAVYGEERFKMKLTVSFYNHITQNEFSVCKTAEQLRLNSAGRSRCMTDKRECITDHRVHSLFSYFIKPPLNMMLYARMHHGFPSTIMVTNLRTLIFVIPVK